MTKIKSMKTAIRKRPKVEIIGLVTMNRLTKGQKEVSLGMVVKALYTIINLWINERFQLQK